MRAHGVPLFLQPDVGLVIREKNILLERKGVPVSHDLGVAEAIALSCLAAAGEYESALKECFSCLPQAEFWLSRVIDRYWTYLGEGPARPIDFQQLLEFGHLRPIFSILPQSHIKQEAAPASITWMVTLGCNRKCPYCFFNVYHFGISSKTSPPDATFPLPDVVRMVKEMGHIGAADLYLTGGEPLLRADLPEIIAEASRARVRTHAVTKYPVSREFAQRLATAGISSITVSLDDARAKQAAALAGAPGYLSEAVCSIEALLTAGIAVDVNAVVNKVNASQLERLAIHVAELGVRRLKLSPFHSPYPQRKTAEKLATDVDLGRELQRLQTSSLTRRLEVVVGDGADASSERKCGSRFVCEIGTRALDVLPDGSVSRCHYLYGMPEMKLGDLRNQTLLEVWNSQLLRSMARPDRSAFQSTACCNCEQHEGCNSRGRCFVSSLQDSGRLYAPDSFCTRAHL